MKSIDRTEISTLALAGLIGEISFEAYAWLISPLIFGVQLEPAKLVTALTKIFTGIQLPYAGAFVLHFLIGAVGFATVVYLFKQLTKLGYLTSGLAAGFSLWFVAQGILAPVVGRTFMMGFGSYTQSSFVGHVGMCVLMGFLWQKFMSRNDSAAA
jgi:uncharacterized membrane protein YagU involved in acid resistance